MSNRRRLRVPGRYEHQPQVQAVQEPVEAIRPLVQALAGSIRRKAVAESTATLERPPARTAVREASVGGATATGSGRMLLRLITAGWSLNNNMYPAEVLRRDGPGAWPAGTRCYVDHASEDEEQSHPSGSVKNLAAVLTEDARWDEATQSLVAEARLFEPWRGPLTQMAEAKAIGMSIRAWVTGTQGERDGREGYVVDWVEGRSVDFVTVPAAGGEVISVLEAVNTQTTAEAATLGGWLESRLHLVLTQYADDMYGNGQLTREERIVLSGAIGDGLQAWTARVEADAPQLFQRDRWSEPEPQAPPMAAGESAAAEPEPEAAEVPAVPAPATDVVTPDVTEGAPPPAPSSTILEEEPVSGTQTGAPPEQAGIAPVPGSGTVPVVIPPTVIEAAQPSAESMAATVQRLLAEAMRPLTEQIAAFQAREGQRDAESRNVRNRQVAAEAVTTALRATEHADVVASISGRVNTRVLADVPVTTEGAVDDARLAECITAVIADESTHVRRERANALAEAGVGMPFGMGATTAQESEDDGLEAELTIFFKDSLGMTEQAASVAGKGRR